jgi:hypothetical protein
VPFVITTGIEIQAGKRLSSRRAHFFVPDRAPLEGAARFVSLYVFRFIDSGNAPPEELAGVTKRIPAGYVGKVEDIVAAVR